MLSKILLCILHLVSLQKVLVLSTYKYISIQPSHWQSLQSKGRCRGYFHKVSQKSLCWINCLSTGKVQSLNFTANATKFSKTSMLWQTFTTHFLKSYVNPGLANHLTGTGKVNNISWITSPLLKTLSCHNHEALSTPPTISEALQLFDWKRVNPTYSMPYMLEPF